MYLPLSGTPSITVSMILITGMAWGETKLSPLSLSRSVNSGDRALCVTSVFPS